MWPLRDLCRILIKHRKHRYYIYVYLCLSVYLSIYPSIQTIQEFVEGIQGYNYHGMKWGQIWSWPQVLEGRIGEVGKGKDEEKQKLEIKNSSSSGNQLQRSRRNMKPQTNESRTSSRSDRMPGKRMQTPPDWLNTAWKNTKSKLLWC